MQLHPHSTSRDPHPKLFVLCGDPRSGKQRHHSSLVAEQHQKFRTSGSRIQKPMEWIIRDPRNDPGFRYKRLRHLDATRCVVVPWHHPSGGSFRRAGGHPLQHLATPIWRYHVSGCALKASTACHPPCSVGTPEQEHQHGDHEAFRAPASRQRRKRTSIPSPDQLDF